ncbi:hypothetical protein [Arthrobacter sp. NPDC090010]|uniref:hypothetical protein n=1 Tax=Arthrobacter sp. NPDC090010 TaxID=3363942 RepID=UPI0037F25E5D
MSASETVIPPGTSPLAHAAARPRILIAGLAIAAGLFLTLLWDPNFVDKVVGQGIAHAVLGDANLATAGWLGSLVVAAVTGLAGTFTACNVACFASLGPLAASNRGGTPGRWALVRVASGQLGAMAIGQMIVAALYGAVVVLSARSLPMLDSQSTGGIPPRLGQASVINVMLGVGLIIVATLYLRGRSLRPGRGSLIAFGALLGLLLVGRPYPMFRDVLEQAAASGNVLGGSAMMILVVLGNMVLISVLFLGFIALAGPALQRFSTARPRVLLTIAGALLLIMGVFSVAYWGVRVPSMFGVLWFSRL